jgi:hypothetical protein
MPDSAKARGVILSLFFVLLPFLFPWAIILSLFTRLPSWRTYPVLFLSVNTASSLTAPKS